MRSVYFEFYLHKSLAAQLVGALLLPAFVYLIAILRVDAMQRVMEEISDTHIAFWT